MKGILQKPFCVESTKDGWWIACYWNTIQEVSFRKGAEAGLPRACGGTAKAVPFQTRIYACCYAPPRN
jgi:hypothetical protein